MDAATSFRRWVQWFHNRIAACCNNRLQKVLASRLAPECLREHTNKLLWFLLVFVMTSVGQLVAFIWQLNHTQSQATRINVSMLTMGALSVLDAYYCLFYYSGLGRFPSLKAAFAVAAFAKFVLALVYEMRYMYGISYARNAAEWANGWNAVRTLSAIFSSVFSGLEFATEAEPTTKENCWSAGAVWLPATPSA